MRFKKTSSLILLLIFSLSSLAQTTESRQGLAAVQGIGEVRSRTFTETSLYGYINGGAELYLEYGFDTLVVTELVRNGRDIKVEIYRMKDPEAAFGIFSVSRFRCNGGPRLTEHLCRSAYQLQLCKGPFYVSIINDTGTKEDQETADEIATGILANIPEASFDPTLFFEEPVDDETMRGAVLVRGPLGLYNGIPELSDTFGEATGYSALMIQREGRTRASLRFESPGTATEVLRCIRMSPAGSHYAISSDSVVSIISPSQIIITF
jgi:hypothetical protein